eukprot:1182310-Rhodomonas_salina.2
MPEEADAEEEEASARSKASTISLWSCMHARCSGVRPTLSTAVLSAASGSANSERSSAGRKSTESASASIGEARLLERGGSSWESRSKSARAARVSLWVQALCRGVQSVPCSRTR